MSESRNLASKHVLAESFGKAAADYDRSAHLQKKVGKELVALSSKLMLDSERGLVGACGIDSLVDLGCGTGYFLPELDSVFKPSTLFAVDLSQAMLKHAQVAMRDKQIAASLSFVESDAESLSLADHSVEMVFSSLALQWVVDIDQAISEAFRVLKPGGVLSFSTLLDGTLSELKGAWAQVDDEQHVNDFLEQSDYALALERSGLEVVYEQSENIELEYQQAMQLMRDLKAIGAHNISKGRSKKLTSPGKLKRVIAAYESHRKSNDMLPAHYVAGYFVAQKPFEES